MQNSISPATSTPLNRNFYQVIQSYVQLTKPRIIVLLLVTTGAAVFLASEGEVDPVVLLATLLGGWLAAAAANTINCLYDRDIDEIMERTSLRPLPSGRVRVRDAMIFAGVLAGLSFILLNTVTNLLAALLAQAGIVFYVLIYTHWLKRHSTQNIVIGGAAGAIPPLVGWAAVTGELSWSAWVLFLIIFLWTPPHFWALAIYIRDEYAGVDVPMLPVIAGNEVTAKQIWIYTWLMLASTVLLVYPLGDCGLVYVVSAIALSIPFVKKAWQLLGNCEDTDVARSLFKYSILYMMLLCGSMALDSLPWAQQVSYSVAQRFETLLSLVSLGA